MDGTGGAGHRQHHHVAGSANHDLHNSEFRQLHAHVHQGMNISAADLSKLSEHERSHLLLHQKHFGHEGMHAAMLLILIVAIFLSQVVLLAWKKKAPKNFQNVSMFGVWVVPFAIALYNHWFRFIGIWSVVSLLTLAVIFRPLTQKHINGSIPRLIYRWFYYLYAVSSVTAVTGYVIIMGTFLGLNLLLALSPQVTLDIGFLLLFYGIYFGVLTRDFTDFLVDILAANIGYYSPSSSLPSKQLKSTICAICGRAHGDEEMTDKSGSSSAPLLNNGLTTTRTLSDEALDPEFPEGNDRERTYTLSCGHKFHEYCIYGWSLVGKKQMCPFCREKVDTSRLFSSLSFQKPHYLYGNLLDFIRYLLAWQPLILFAAQGVNYWFGLE